MAIQALDRAVEATRARLSADGGLLVTVALALIGVPGMLMQVAFRRLPMVDQMFAGRTVQLPEPSGVDLVAILALLLAQMLGQLAVARMVAASGETVREALAVAGRRFPAFLGASLLLGLVGTGLLLMAGAVLGLLGALGGPGILLALIVGVALAVALVIALARLQLLIPQAVRGDEGPLRMVTAAWSRGRGLTGSLIVLLIVVFLLATVVPGAAQLLLGIPTAFAAGPDAGAVAGAIGSGLVGSLVTLLALALAVAVHAVSRHDQRDVRGG